MLLPQEMTAVEIVVPERDVLAVTGELADQGIFHQVDASYLGAKLGLGSADNWQSQASACMALERRVLGVMQALDAVEGPLPSGDRLPMIELEAVGMTVESLEREVRALTDDLAGEQQELEELQGTIRQLEPLADLDVDVSILRNPRYVFAMLGTMPAANVERLQTSLERIAVVLLTLRQDGRQAVVWLFGAQRHADILERAARSAYLNPLVLPRAYQGTPAQIIEAIQAEIERIRQRVVQRKGEMAELHANREQQLRALLWRVRTSRMRMEAMARFGRLRYTYLIVGWVPTARLEALSRRLRQASKEILIEANPSRRGSTEQNVPVALDHRSLVRAFQELVTTYGWPRYGEIDPTLLLVFTFPLLFGAMFGDVGHGMILALLGGLLASRLLPALRGLAKLGTVVAVCGLVATAFGFLYGSIFGIEDVLPALWIRPMTSIMQILMVAIGVGVVLLSVGFLIAIVNAWIAREWDRLLFAHNGIAGLGLYWSLLGLGLRAFLDPFPVPAPALIALAVLSGLGVMFSEPLGRLVRGRRPLIEGGVGTYVIQALFELFETLISLFSNSLSYVRVGAFAVAHGGLSAVILILAEMVSPGRGVGYWVVVALGNLFIIGFEGLIVGIQTLRLSYYEFFGKFFTAGGTRYQPLTTFSRVGE